MTGRDTFIDLQDSTDKQTLEPNRVYVIAPARVGEVERGVLLDRLERWLGVPSTSGAAHV